MRLLILLPMLLCVSDHSIGKSFDRESSVRTDQKHILNMMDRVTQWQLDNPSGKKLWVWEYGAFYAGLMTYYELNPQKRYLDAMVSMGKQMHWELKPHPYLADNFAIAQTYIDLYRLLGDPAFIDKTQYVMDMEFYKRPRKPDLRWVDNPHRLHWWSWSDALFMAPPAFAKMSQVTQDPKYIDKMDRLWRLTYRYLYDKKEALFFRDDSYFELRTKHNKKVFWSRGNGWVIGGLVRVLEEMPEDYPSRKFYEQLLQKMAARLIELQAPEGHWYPSLLDKEDYDVQETSGTAFFTYALAWGINNQLLDRGEYLPYVLKAWESLVSAVQPDGKLGYVQRVGVGPDKVKKDDTETYGTGAFLLAGTEVYRLLGK